MTKYCAKILIILSLLWNYIRAEFQICDPAHATAVFRFTSANCPSGVLFNHPVNAYCLQGTTDPSNFITDLCEPEGYTITDTTARPLKIQLAYKISEEAASENDVCLGEGPEKCNVTDYTDASTQTMTEPGGIGCDPDDDEEEVIVGAEEQVETHNDTLIANQTERLFKYMLGLTVDPTEAAPDLRVVKILRQSFKILGKFCDPKYVPLEFGKDVLQAFLYLFRESDKFGFIDISVDDYKSIKKTLDYCEKLPKLFTLNGQTCKSCANVHSIEKNGRSRRYIQDEFSFEWGKYDVPTDATWSVINFIHGLCYGNYRPHVNYHHLYQREMERLFLPPMLKRWGKPVTLHHDDLWDHILSAKVKNAMRNLDVCITAAYYDTPFLHRLERPKLNQDNETEAAAPPPPPASRKKRSLPPMALDEGGLEGAGWCFQTPEDMRETVEAYIHVHCPENKKVLEDINASLKEDASDSPQQSDAASSPSKGGDDGFEDE